MVKNEQIKHPLMRYHGGKFRLAPWVMNFFPEHRCYVEPFGGAAGVLLQKTRSYSEVYNDLDEEISNVFSVLQDKDKMARLVELLVFTPYSRDEFNRAYEPAGCPVERCRRTLIRASMGFGSAAATKGRSGFRNDSKRDYSIASHLWAQYPDQIENFCTRLAGVLIENRPAVEVIKKHDCPDTLFYVDPPYVHDSRQMSGGRYYRHEMTDEDHIELLETLLNLKGMVVLSGYHSELYANFLTGWELFSTSARIGANRGCGVRTEVIWLNPQCLAAQKQRQLFAVGAGNYQ
jgi:DNA adenine methylase